MKMIPFKHSIKSGFTLVELSVVLIIVGLLIAGIASGNSLIKQAQLDRIITDMQNYITAYETFKVRFDAVPGDMSNAFAFWGTKCAAVAQDCNGDGNGTIRGTLNGSIAYYETIGAWKHMSLAGVIANSFDLMPSVNASTTAEIGKNNPAGPLNNSGYTMIRGVNDGSYYPGGSPWIQRNVNVIIFGSIAPNGAQNGWPVVDYGILDAIDAFSIDKKIDDGNLLNGNALGFITGRLRTIEGSNVTPQGDCVVVSGQNQYYNLNGDKHSCTIMLQINQ